MINNGIGFVKLKEGGFLKLDVEDYGRFKDIDWFILKKDNGSSFVAAKKPEGRYCMYLHRELGIWNEKKDKNKQLVFINGDRLDYRKENITFKFYKPSNRKGEKNVNHRKVTTKEGKLNLEGFIVGIIENKAIIAIDDKRDLVCAICSQEDLNKYMECLDYAAYDGWPGWKCLGGPHCKELRKRMEEAFDEEDKRMVA